MEKKRTTISLIIHDVNNDVYNGDVLSVSSVNASGPFDILPEHSNFITIISEKIIFIEPSKKKFEVKIKKAVLKCENSKVDIYIGIEKLV